MLGEIEAARHRGTRRDTVPPTRRTDPQAARHNGNTVHDESRAEAVGKTALPGVARPEPARRRPKTANVVSIRPDTLG